MPVSIKNLCRMASPETGNVTFWHYKTAANPLEAGYFNACYQLLGEDDLIFCIICAPEKPPITSILTVVASSRDGVIVRPPVPAAKPQLEKEASNAQTLDREPVRGGGSAEGDTASKTGNDGAGSRKTVKGKKN